MEDLPGFFCRSRAVALMYSLGGSRMYRAPVKRPVRRGGRGVNFSLLVV